MGASFFSPSFAEIDNLIFNFVMAYIAFPMFSIICLSTALNYDGVGAAVLFPLLIRSPFTEGTSAGHEDVVAFEV